MPVPDARLGVDDDFFFCFFVFFFDFVVFFLVCFLVVVAEGFVVLFFRLLLLEDDDDAFFLLVRFVVFTLCSFSCFCVSVSSASLADATLSLEDAVSTAAGTVGVCVCVF